MLKHMSAQTRCPDCWHTPAIGRKFYRVTTFIIFSCRPAGPASMPSRGEKSQGVKTRGHIILHRRGTEVRYQARHHTKGRCVAEKRKQAGAIARAHRMLQRVNRLGVDRTGQVLHVREWKTAARLNVTKSSEMFGCAATSFMPVQR